MGVSSSKNMQRNGNNNIGKKEPLKEEYPKSIKKSEIEELFKKEDSICKINGKSEKIKSMGFFLNINNEDIPFKKCLITNNHILDKSDIKINSKINIEYQNIQKEIEINKNRKVFTNKDLDYTCIEIFDEDNIKQYFEIDENIKDINSYKDKEIFILQYKNDDELSFSYGKIISIENNKIKHSSSIKEGSSGLPIISRYSKCSLIGLHYGSVINKEYNYLTSINTIINDIIKKINNLNNLIIISEINIGKDEENEDIQIINSYEEFVRRNNKYNKNIKYEEEYKNENEIKDNCEIEINEQIIPFSYSYKFEKEGKYIIKYSFNENLTRINHIFSLCEKITSINLSHFKTDYVTNISHLFYKCESLKNIDLSNTNTINVINMSHMFYGCESLENIDLSNINTTNVINMSEMFHDCKSLKILDLSKFNTQNVTDMNHMFIGCKSLTKIDLSNFNTENVISMKGMFHQCEALTELDLSNFNKDNLQDISLMFSDCQSLKKLNLSNFNISKIPNKDNIFNECENLTKENIITKDKDILNFLKK